MGQSPIQFVIEQALPLLHPKNLLTICDSIPEFGRATLKGEEGHRNFEFQLPQPQPFCLFRSREYDLFRIHIHTKPEHCIKGGPASQLELHLLCIPRGGTDLDPKVVIAILINVHSAAAFHSGIAALAKAFEEGIRTIETGSPANTVEVPIRSLFPDEDTINWLHYEGSLTSYPFSEDVSWFVLKTISEATADNVSVFTIHVSQEARELQPLNRRLVVRSFAVESDTQSHASSEPESPS